MYVILDRFDEVLPPALGKRDGFYAGISGLIQANGDINEVNPGTLQGHGDLHAVLNMDVVLGNTGFVQELFNAQTHANGKIRAAGIADAGDDFGNHPQAVFKAAAVLVLPLIGVGGQELLEQIAVGCVEFHTVTAGLLHPDGSCDELGDELLHLLGGQRAGLLLQVFAGDGRCGNHRLSANEGRNRLAAGVVELDKYFGAVLVDCRRQPGQAGDVTVLRHGQLPHQPRTVDIVHAGDLRNNEAGAAYGPGLVEGQHILRRTAVQLCQTDAHGGHDQTVLDRDLADLSGSKQILVHENSSFLF